MPVAILRCPHCDAENMTFSFGGEYLIRSAKFTDGFKTRSHPSEWSTLFVCRRCKDGVVFRVYAPAEKRELKPSECSGELFHEGFKLISLHPRPQPIEAPEHTPPEVIQTYIDGVGSLRAGRYNAAEAMFRAALDRATKLLAPAGKEEQFRKMQLKARIAKLAEGNAVTTAMSDWADIIREKGNETLHEKDTDKPSATELYHFTEMFLTYAFTLPGQVEAYRHRAQATP